MLHYICLMVVLYVICRYCVAVSSGVCFISLPECSSHCVHQPLDCTIIMPREVFVWRCVWWLTNLLYSAIIPTSEAAVHCLKFAFASLRLGWGTGIRGLMRGMATLPQGNQELLVVRDKVGRPPGELGVSKSMECDIFPFIALTLLVGRQEWHRPVKYWVLICWWWWLDWGFARLIAPVVTNASIIVCFDKHRLTHVHLENGR